ncbi:DUF4231 domain-containing protein [Nocardia sp. NPDC049707]|uniref:DUF4231 domain-containing protein n=1 Tax=Nocardia sp. NPDC049707 TaxID=3154735 RepID=UPI00344906A6
MTAADGRRNESDPVWARLTDQRDWYEQKSGSAQRAYRWVKLGQIAVGAAIPVVALTTTAIATAVLSAVVVVAEGAQQLFQWQTNWLSYRATAEALKHEQVLYAAEIGVYASPDRRRVLAERVESLVSQENSRWSEIQQRGGEGERTPG